jgi:putative hydrolase of the HAD superfamily
MDRIKNIVFDLGAVLIDIDFNKVAYSFKQLGFSNFEQHYSQLQANELFQQLEKGVISDIEFYTAIQQQIDVPLSHAQIQNAWNSILLKFRLESMQLLTSLKNKYRLFLLSNTNAIHLKEINAILFQQTNNASLDSYFKKAYYSHIIGMRKPSKEIFSHVLEDSNILANETLFIDDSFPNIETANQMGFRTHLLLPGEKIEHIGLLKT